MGIFCKGILYTLKKPFAALALTGLLIFGLDFGLASARSGDLDGARTLNSVENSDFRGESPRFSSVFVRQPVEVAGATMAPDLWNETLEKLVRFINKQNKD